MTIHQIIKNSLILFFTLVFSVSCSADTTPSVDESLEDLTKNALALTLVEQMNNGRFDEAVVPFNDKMRAGLPADKLKQVWQQINTQAGAFQRVLDTSQKRKDNNVTVFVATQFEHAILDTKVAFDQDNKIIGLFFSPSKYKPSSEKNSKSKNTKTQAIQFGEENWKLNGEVTYPKSGSNFPLVILVHGSGPQDMDTSIGPNKPFLDIANGLADLGVATLRYNKRTFEHTEKYAENPSLVSQLTITQETVDDVVHAFSFAQTLNTIDSSRIFIAGHSQGAMMMGRIAQRVMGANGYIMLAAPARGLDVLATEQIEYILTLNKELPDEQKQAFKDWSKQVDVLNALTVNSNVNASELPLGLSKAYWLDLKAYDIVAEAKKIKKPLLIAQGGRDYQVLADKDFKMWQDAFSQSNNVTLKLFPKLNHLMMAGEDQSIPAEYLKPANVDNEFISTLGQWIDTL